METLQLEFAFGMRGHDARGNVFYTNRGEIVYTTAALAILYHREMNTQRFLADNPALDSTVGHTGDIVSLARHPSGQIFATGEVGRSPKILVWSADDPGKPLACLQGALQGAVPALTFSRDGTLLAAVGLDAQHSVVVYRWQTGTLLATSRGGPTKIVAIAWSPFQDYLVTVGVRGPPSVSVNGEEGGVSGTQILAVFVSETVWASRRRGGV